MATEVFSTQQKFAVYLAVEPVGHDVSPDEKQWHTQSSVAVFDETGALLATPTTPGELGRFFENYVRDQAEAAAGLLANRWRDRWADGPNPAPEAEEPCK